MLQVTNNTFNKNLQLQHSVGESFFTKENVDFFDNDGFELTGLEVAYYEEHGIDYVHNGILNHRCDQRPWIQCNDNKFIVDHSMLLQRWEFTSTARYQISNNVRKFPQLTKYLNIVPKWGIDFALDYYNGDTAVEVLHIENDFRSYEQAIEAKSKIQDKILNTDWNDFTRSILSNKEQWSNLVGFAQNDWKAVYWGLTKAEITEKAYA